MKFKTGLHLLVAAMIAFGVTSCGGDKNSTDSGAANTPINGVNTSITANPGQGANTRDEFYNEVANNRFDEASDAGLYSFPKNNSSSSNFNFDFCWGYDDCMEQQQERSQSQVNNYYWRFLDSDRNTVYRNFTANGATYSAPVSDSQFGSTVSSLREGLLNIIRNASKVEKYSQYYGWQDISMSISAYSGSIDLSNYYNNNNNNNYNQRSKIFRFRYNSRYYIIDLTKALMKNPTAVY
ncbi:hypothetical protein A9Q84_18565 [Halobacteriovorax marinus]|uniref:Lipoprotein n=1 Tax=Halobacteriovorax marinus TaxID=97084 RepID=A0A1Y5F7V0_9BACT|nr:hypothetical protein A9Q84_18565 [Halobacteriovorax marinus]